MNLQNALKIDGWMIESELKWLAEQAKNRKVIAEIGSWRGRTTRALADNTSGIVYAIDTWDGSEEHQEFLKDKPKDWLYDEFLTNTRGLCNVCPTRGYSINVANCFKQSGFVWKFDMIFLDASHDYENVKNDILAWRPLLFNSGILCGHDYSDTWPGVKQAVHEIFQDNVVFPANDIWCAI